MVLIVATPLVITGFALAGAGPGTIAVVAAS